MFMRPEADPPVAFQEYALLAIVAVAAHVGGVFGGDKARGLPALAAHYHHPPDQLEKVNICLSRPLHDVALHASRKALEWWSSKASALYLYPTAMLALPCVPLCCTCGPRVGRHHGSLAE